MKKRRTLIISLLLIAAMALGIGYAGFSVNMLVNGDAKLNGIESQVVFESATLTSQSTNAIVLTKGGENTNALSIKLAGFKEVGNKATVTIVVKNPHDFAVDVDLVTFDTDGKMNGTGAEAKQYLKVTHDYPATQHIEPNGSYTFTMTVECLATTADAVTENFELKLLAKAGSQTSSN